MKKLLITLVYIVSFSGLVSCQTATAPATGEDKNAPEMTFSTTTVHDFGTIPYDGNGTFDFEFKNTGKEPLVLSDVRSSCGCTTPEWPRLPIKKGEKAVIKVKYNTKIVGSFNKSIYITSNAKTPKIILTIKGNVENNTPKEATSQK